MQAVLFALYDTSWSSRFSEEQGRLLDAFGPTAIRVDHGGSISVPYHAAKQTIEIQFSVSRRTPSNTLEPQRTTEDTFIYNTQATSAPCSSSGQPHGLYPITFKSFWQEFEEKIQTIGFRVY